MPRKRENCIRCGKVVTLNITRLDDGHVYCLNCRREIGAFKCPHCHEHKRGNQLFVDTDDYYYNIRDEKFMARFFKYIKRGSCYECATQYIYEYKDNAKQCPNCRCYHTEHNQYCAECEANLKPCISCKTETHKRHQVDGVMVNLCDDCVISKELIKCSCCGNYTKHTNESSLPEYTTILCTKCQDRYPIMCPMCHKPNNQEAMTDVMGQEMCYECSDNLSRCKLCNKFDVLNTVRTKDGKLVWVCEECARTHNKGIMQPWNYKPGKLKYHGRDYSNPFLFFGFENETYIRSRLERIKTKHMGKILHYFPIDLLYSKFDGSIGGNTDVLGGEHGAHGFELVSHPMTFEYFKQFPNWKKMFTIQTIKHDTCGMHIHITRAAFTPLHLYKFISLVHANDSFIEYIAERSLKGNKYTTNISGENIAKDCIKYKKGKGGREQIYRRAKVNLCNDFTIELRFFSNVTKVEQLHKNMEFAHALFSYSRELPQSYATDIDMFIDYIKEHRKLYPELNTFLECMPWERKENTLEDDIANKEERNNIEEYIPHTNNGIDWNFEWVTAED